MRFLAVTLVTALAVSEWDNARKLRKLNDDLRKIVNDLR